MSSMVKTPPGYHALFAQIPAVVWDALEQRSEQTGEPITSLVTRLLADGLGVSRESLPKRRKPGPKPKRKGKS